MRATGDGYVAGVDAYAIGVAAWRLGAGRARKEDPVSAAAGVVLHRQPGEPVRAGEVLYELRADERAGSRQRSRPPMAPCGSPSAGPQASRSCWIE